MTVSFVGSASAESTSVTLPTHQAGDLILMLWYGAQLGSSIPAGWQHHQTRLAFSPNTTVCLLYKIAASSAETSGTFAASTLHLLSSVYRHSSNYILLGNGNNGTAASTSLAHPALSARGTSTAGSIAMRQATGWIAGFATGYSNATNLDTQIPDVMTSRHVITGASIGESVAFDTNATVASFAGQTKTISGSTQWYSIVAEILDTGIAKTAAGGLLLPRSMDGGYAS